MGLGKTLTMIALILRSKELKKDNEENITASPRGKNQRTFPNTFNLYIPSARYEKGQNPCCVPCQCPETVGVGNYQ